MSGCLVFAAAVTSLVPIGSVEAQQTLPDFRTNGYSPPVHIPPRVPHYDPGLPSTLNGRFNATQQIRANTSAGLHANLSDFSDQPVAQAPQTQVFRNATRESRPRRTASRPVVNQRNGTGLQQRISGMLSSNDRAQGGQRTASRSGRSNGNVAQARQPQQQIAVQRSVPNQIAYAQSNVVNNATGSGVRRPQTRPVARPEPATRQIAKAEPQRYTYAKKPKQSVVRSEPSRARQRPVRAASVLQTGEDQNSYVRYNSAAGPQEEVAAVQQSFVPRSNSNPLPRRQSPRAAAQEFRRNLKSQTVASGTQDQIQLPVTPSLDQQQIEAISVLSSPQEEAISLDPVVDYDSGVESVIPETYEYNEINETLPQGNGNNLLRTPVVYQDDEDLDSDLDELRVEDDDDSYNYDEEDDNRTSPLRKSCEEFRFDLLGKPITDIALDISPPAKLDTLGGSVYRVWRDSYGNELAQGTIQDIRRGYLIISTGGGGQVRIPYARLSEADWLAVSDYWRLPIECGLGAGTYTPRAWVPQTVSWHASAVCHKPLYFENIQLERYGHSHGPFLQPVASSVHFFSRLFFLPYQTAINPPNECQYALGFYRPGNCAPWLKDPVPLSLQGLSRQSLIFTGIGFLTD